MEYLSVKYFMTVTLLPKAFKLTPEEQYDEYVGKLMNRLLGLSSRLFVVVELTRSYNLHFHLIVQFTKKSKNHIRDVYNLLDVRQILVILIYHRLRMNLQ